MNRADAVKLCRLVKSLCPSQTFDEYTPDAWMLILAGYDYDDAKTAVAALVSAPLEPGRARYIEPGHIIGGIDRLRRKRLEAAMPEPPSGLDTRAYLDWLRRTRAQIANGHTPTPSDAPPARPELVAEIRQIAAGLGIDRQETHP